MLRRRRERKTDYRQRLKMLKSGKIRLVIRRSLNNIRIQFVKYAKQGDKTVVDVYSKILKKYGYLGHGGNVTAAYLTGLVAGLEARKKGIEEAIVDIGLHRTTKGSSLFAAAKGVLDSGVHVNVSEDKIPDEKRLSGSHIAEYANKIKDSEKYQKQFSLYIKNGMKPENFLQHFEDVKKRIMKEIQIPAKKSE